MANKARPAKDGGGQRPFVVVDQAGYTWMRRQRGLHYVPRRFKSKQTAQAAIDAFAAKSVPSDKG